MKKVFIQSCHGSLEFDHAVMFRMMGHSVAGNFDVGCKQRPKLEGITDKSYDIRAAYADADILVQHQCDDYPRVFATNCHEMGDRPVVLTYFGQGCEEQHMWTADILLTRPNAYCVCYSKKEERMFKELGVPENKFRMIRFGKLMDEFSEFGGWNGHLPIAYMTCNSVERRGDGCGWPAMKELMDSVMPMILSGKETETLKRGIGELDYEGMKSMYRNARCFVSLGTVPAPLVLTQIEAMVTGCPVIVLDNGCGMAEEDLPVTLCSSVAEVKWWVNSLIESYPLACRLAKHAATKGEEEFNMKRVAAKWEAFINTMVKP